MTHNHDHDHNHDSHTNAHCHCDGCSIERSEGGGEQATCEGHSHSSEQDSGCCCDTGGDEEDDPSHSHGDSCGCGHDHEHGEELSIRQLWVLGSGAVLFAASVLLRDSLSPLLSLVLFLAAYLVIGGDVLLRAAKNILRGQIFDENFLMAIATVGAFAIGDYPEAVAVMLFYQVGELFQSYAVGRSRRSIAELMDIRPDYANLAGPDGTTTTVQPQEVSVGAQIIIRPGERIPLDSRVLEGSSLVDTAALTGESVPRTVSAGDTLLSGCINQTGLLRAEVTSAFAQSTVAKILELAENASSKKARAQQFITRFAKVYTPLVVLAALLLAVVPPLFVEGAVFSDWLYRALVFLVISCPCALVISVPLSFFGGIGGASRCGVLVKGGNYLETLANADIVVFDKTGTLTKGSFAVTEVTPVEGVSCDELLTIAATVESFSTHPIARSVVASHTGELDVSTVSNYTELSGRGVSAMSGNRRVLAGNRKLMQEHSIAVPFSVATGTEVLVADDGLLLGRLIISDTVKPDSAAAIAALRSLGVRKTVMLTGDSEQAAHTVAAEVGVDEYHAQLLPADKVSIVEKLMQERKPGGTLVFVGDGINDAPVLARADVGVAMGGLGSDAAIEAADVVLMTDQPMRLVTGIRIARRTAAIVRQNVAFALGVKLLVMALGAVGYAGMWAAVFADVGVSVLAILNAMRALRTRKLL